MNELLNRWQKRLGLLDWDVTIQVRTPDIFPDKGQVDWDGDLKKAVVTLQSGNPDMELTLVHELLHLHFADCEVVLNALEPFLGSIALEVAKRQMQVGVERAVEKLATALVAG